MNIAVIMKQTPDTETVIRLSPDSKRVDTSGIKWIINPYDEFAIEGALRLREKHGGTVSVISYGPQRVVESLRTALAMGADDAVLIDDAEMKGTDFLRKTSAIAAAVKEKNPDIILIGSRTVDYDQGQRGAVLAQMLGLPHLGLAVSLDSDGSKVVVERPIEGGKVTLESPLPALITFGGSHAVWNPRYASLPGIMKAKKKPLVVKKLADLGLDPAEFSADKAAIRITSMELPKPRKAGIIIDGGLDTGAKAKELARLLREEAKAI